MVMTSRIWPRLSVLLLGTVLALAWTPDAFAQQAKTLGEMTNRFYDSFISLQFFLSLLSYILGIFFSITGFKMMRDHVDDPGRNPAKNFILRLAAASFFIFAPFLADALIEAIGGGGVGDTELLNVSTEMHGANTSGKGLEGALTRFVLDFGAPFLDNLLPFFAFIAGLVLMLVGLKRIALASGDGPQAPGGFGTFGTFIVAAGLMSFGYIMYAMQMSIFGADTLMANTAINSKSTLSVQANRALWGVFIFLRIVGYISVLRGLFMLRAFAEGGNVSIMAVSTHMIAGSLLANAGYFVNALQYTFIGTDESKFVFNPIH